MLYLRALALSPAVLAADSACLYIFKRSFIRFMTSLDGSEILRGAAVGVTGVSSPV